ncbi:hypothetical protein [Rubrivirga sp.]|uniref:hypothetical protein n=1 Tax=Rubrivirga sp. TaxID=1885344 RepID=UPI003C72881D
MSALAWRLSLLGALALSPVSTRAQNVFGNPDGVLEGAGWAGFTDVRFLVHATIILIVAAVLSAVIAYHPRTRQRVDSVGEAEAPKVYLTYGIVGAVIGLMVVQYGLVVGFVVFGIGGLLRFRTTLESVADTGRLILVALIGLSCGMDLPHLAVLTTAFAFGLIFVLEHRVTGQLVVKNLKAATLEDASDAYRALVEEHGEVIRQNRSYGKKEVSFIFRAPNRFDRSVLEGRFQNEIPDGLRGTVDWELH